jgi:hypothetical protein
VVFPEPLGPRSDQEFPLADRQIDIVDRIDPERSCERALTVITSPIPIARPMAVTSVRPRRRRSSARAT